MQINSNLKERNCLVDRNKNIVERLGKKITVTIFCSVQKEIMVGINVNSLDQEICFRCFRSKTNHYIGHDSCEIPAN